MCTLRLPQQPEVTDHDTVHFEQQLLLKLAQRTMALSVGRGIFTLSTARSLLTEAIPIPPLVLAGRKQSNNASVSLDVMPLPSDFSQWPEFHNGVAAGLRLASGQADITRTWIVYNKPSAPNHAHAGLLMGLGLQGHLKALEVTDVYRYLTQEHHATNVGVLLGMAGAYRGTSHPLVSKMMCLHIPAIHPISFPDLEVPSIVQTAALIGIGLVYQGTANRRMTEVLLLEIGHRATNDRLTDREGYSLAAGLALGLVTLGSGNSATGLADLHVENRLRQYMVGGRDPEVHATAVVADATQCCRIKEGEMVNVDITAPGATLALGMMFMKTNNASVAARLSIPDTHFLMEYVRPDFFVLRVVAKSIVMWDDVEPTQEWIDRQVPGVIHNFLAGETAEPTERLDTNEGFDHDAVAVRQARVIMVWAACNNGVGCV